jgi:hypothetical protein
MYGFNEQRQQVETDNICSQGSLSLLEHDVEVAVTYCTPKKKSNVVQTRANVVIIQSFTND